MRKAIVLNSSGASSQADLILSPGSNMRFDFDELSKEFGQLTTLELDLITVAVSIFSCDLAFAREERENFVRAIDLTIPVCNFHAFERLKGSLTHLLWLLTHDSWKITFQQSDGDPESKINWQQKDGNTLLFSGGLDSLAGAVDYLSDPGPDNLLLASHLTANRVTRESQDSLFSYLESKFGKLKRVRLRTRLQNSAQNPFPTDSDREETQRARSFLFLSLGVLAGRRSGYSKIVALAENGQMAIHLPLTTARIGGFSTHTAHPSFIANSEKYFSDLLSFNFKITNPYLYSTKSEVVKRLVNEHPSAIGLSSSCWRGVRVPDANIKHCGQCVPCLIRRISLEFNGLAIPEFARNILSEDVGLLSSDDDGKRNLIDLAEFVYRFLNHSNAQILDAYPDLFNAHFDFTNAIEMYRRFAQEATVVLKKYPLCSKVLLRETNNSINSTESKRKKK